MLRTLRLSGILTTLEVRKRQAIEGHSSFVESLTAPVQDDEVERRAQNALRLRLRRAASDATKTLEGFDFAFNPRLNKAQVFDLATCQFVDQHENVLTCSPTGVGKSHLAQALAHEACRRGYEVCFVSTAKMLDDFGLKPLRAPGPEDLYDIIHERYERASDPLTSNRDRLEWAELFGEPLLASAALDRLTHRARFLEITGPSYRAEQTKQQRTAHRRSTPPAKG